MPSFIVRAEKSHISHEWNIELDDRVSFNLSYEKFTCALDPIDRSILVICTEPYIGCRLKRQAEPQAI